MKHIIIVTLALVLAFVFFAPLGASAMPFFWGYNDGPRDPALAALLSLTPVPIAFGQFYAGDWPAGLVFTFLEIAEMATAMGVAVYEGAAMMYGGVPIRNWDSTGQIVFFSAIGGVILTKLIDGLSAGLAAEATNRRNDGPKVGLDFSDRGVGVTLAIRL